MKNNLISSLSDNLHISKADRGQSSLSYWLVYSLVSSAKWFHCAAAEWMMQKVPAPVKSIDLQLNFPHPAVQ